MKYRLHATTAAPWSGGALGKALVLGCLAFLAPRAAADGPAAITFEKDISPILTARCGRCHGPKVQKSELNLGTPDGILRGGASGAVIEAHNPDKSLLYEQLRDGAMPPEEIKERPTKAEIEKIRRWIEAGAPFASKPESGPLEADAVVTADEIVPLMLLRCTVCHGSRKQEAGLDLRSRESMLKGGKSGPAIVPGKPQESLVLKRILAEEMPPRRRLVEVGVKPMDPAEIVLLSRWIERGAPAGSGREDVAGTEPDPLVSDKDRQFWSFQPPRAVAPPAVSEAARVRNPIDAFLLAKLEPAGLSLAPAADLRVLVRRAYFDLTGLPPSPEDLEAVLKDPDPLAYEKLIDRLLDSPRYGERWGRYWLDLAGYADSEGKTDADLPRPFAYRYRDYVIRSFNADKPYSRFLLEQLAGDELADYAPSTQFNPEIQDNLVATGFLRMAPDNTFANITDFVPDRIAVVSDEMQILGSSLLGLTIHCARCHSHKFDPIPQRDYYRLTAVFKPALDEHDWLMPNNVDRPDQLESRRYLPYAPPAEIAAVEAENRPLKQQIAELESALRSKARELRECLLRDRAAQVPEKDRAELQKALATAPAVRDPTQTMQIDEAVKQLHLDENSLRGDAEYKKFATETEAHLHEMRTKLKPMPLIRAAWDRGLPSPTYILRRGDPLAPTRRVGPGVLSVLTDGRTPFVPAPPWPGAASTGRRLAFAKWLVEPAQPLTARVMVNRIWKYHFGAGIVSTLGNFGKTGARPTHPELLDWLAIEFVRHGWSMKAMHRLMMTSNTYRQSTQVGQRQLDVDPQNKLLSRMPLRRLEAEAVRDSILLVADRLDERRFGPADPVDARTDGLVTVRGSERGWRRTIYAMQRRSKIPTLLESFDLPQMEPNCVERTTSTVAPQALQLLNDAQIHELAGQFAERLRREAGADPRRQVGRAFAVALGREPTEAELQLTLSTMEQLRKQWTEQLKARVAAGSGEPNPEEINQRVLANVCHALLNSAEFVYID